MGNANVNLTLIDVGFPGKEAASLPQSVHVVVRRLNSNI